MILIDRIKVLEEMLGIMFREVQESGNYDAKIEIGAMTIKDVVYEDGKNDGLNIAYNMIADAPEIKAIPIEWIEEWQNRHEWEYESFFKMKDGKPKYAIECMIEDWEKENANR